MGSLIDMTGKRVGRWTVLARNGRIGRNAAWLCRCVCGREGTVMGSMLRAGKSLSCGCLAKEITSTRRTSHGMTKSATYRTWTAMKFRCSSPSHVAYARYGGRGVRVCERWLVFENFLEDMGERPPDRTLDRIDSDGDYEPGNCRWATSAQQGRNTCTTKLSIGKAREVRRLSKLGMSNAAIGKMFSVAKTTIRSVVQNKTWRE